ncbi:MAG TPA: type II toxin-antitoxin system VapC family toxin [Armatimonadota bacterium]|jgi:predicted nucleic acid-binding protein
MVSDTTLFDAGLLIAALLEGDARHSEAMPLVEAARRGEIQGCTTTSILSEVYAALTWAGALPPHSPQDAAAAISRLVEPSSNLSVIGDGSRAASLMLQLSSEHGLTVRRAHDARHAATALCDGVSSVMTYDSHDWAAFATDGISIVGPPSVLSLHANT